MVKALQAALGQLSSKRLSRVLHSVTKFLGINSDSIDFQSHLKQINPGQYSEKIANYDEVVKTLSGSRYSVFLNS